MDTADPPVFVPVNAVQVNTILVISELAASKVAAATARGSVSIVAPDVLGSE